MLAANKNKMVVLMCKATHCRPCKVRRCTQAPTTSSRHTLGGRCQRGGSRAPAAVRAGRKSAHAGAAARVFGAACSAVPAAQQQGRVARCSEPSCR